MGLADPYLDQVTADGRNAQATADLRRRMAAIERGGGPAAPGGAGAVPDATTVVKGKLQLSGDFGGTATTPVVKKLINLGTTAISDPMLVDINHGGDWSAGSLPAGRYEILHGSTAAPWTGGKPTFRIMSNYDFASYPASGIYGLSTFTVQARGRPTHVAQVQAAAFLAQNYSTVVPSPTDHSDSQAVSGIGEVHGGCLGRGIGGFFYGVVGATADSTASGTGVEGAIRNDNANHTINTVGAGAGSQSMGAWLVNIGTYRAAAALQIGSSTAKWQTGIYVGFKSTGSIIERSTFCDFGQASWSIEIDGPHANGAIGIGPGSGGICIGRSSKVALAALDLGWDATGTASGVAADGILFGNDTNLYRSAAGTLKSDHTLFPKAVATHGTAGVGFYQALSQSSPPSAAGTDQLRLYVANTGANALFRYTDQSANIRTVLSDNGTVSATPQFFDLGLGTAPSHKLHLLNGDETKRTAYLNTVLDGAGGTLQDHYSQFNLTSIDDVQNADPIPVINAGMRTFTNVGVTTASVGSVLGLQGGIDVYKAGHVTNEYAGLWARTQDRTAASAAHPSMWGLDIFSMGTPRNEVNNFLLGGVVGVQTHAASPPTSTDAIGLSIETTAGLHGAPWSSVATQPADVGLLVSGLSGGPSYPGTGIGFDCGIRIGGNRGAWLTSNVGMVGIGLRATHYTIGGIKIHTGESSRLYALQIGLDASDAASTVKEDGILLGTDCYIFRAAANTIGTQAGTTWQAGAYAVSGSAGAGFIQFTNEQSSAPTGTPSNAIRLYSADNGSGVTVLRTIDNAGNIVTLGAGSGGGISTASDSAHLDFTVTGSDVTATILTTATPQLAALGVGVAAAANGIGVANNAAGQSSTQGLYIQSTGRLNINQNSGQNAIIYYSADNTASLGNGIRFSLTQNADGSARLRFADGAGTTNELYKVVGSNIIKVSNAFEAATSITAGTGVIITSGNFAPGEGVNIALGSTTGTKIGTATTQKLGFWNATPVVRPSDYTVTTSVTTHSDLRSFDEDTVTLAQLAQVVATMIKDDQTTGLRGGSVT